MQKSKFDPAKLVQQKHKNISENGTVKKQIMTWLKDNYREATVDKNWGNALQRGGRPDLEITYAKRVFFCELKSPTGKLSTLQQLRIKNNPSIAVADSLESFIRQFNAYFTSEDIKR